MFIVDVLMKIKAILICLKNLISEKNAVYQIISLIINIAQKIGEN